MTSISINNKNHTIELSSAFAKAASLFGSDDYRQLQEARRDYPNYRVVTIKQRNTSIFDVFTIEFLLGCVGNGDYVDPRDVEAHLPPSPAREYLMKSLQEHGIR